MAPGKTRTAATFRKPSPSWRQPACLDWCRAFAQTWVWCWRGRSLASRSFCTEPMLASNCRSEVWPRLRPAMPGFLRRVLCGPACCCRAPWLVWLARWMWQALRATHTLRAHGLWLCRHHRGVRGRLNPVGIVLSAVLMSMFYIGGNWLSRASVCQGPHRVFQGLLLFSLLACDTFIHQRLRWGEPS